MTLSITPALLKSDRGVDYKILWASLKRQDWEIADRLTYLHFQQVLQVPESTWISDRRLRHFPKADLLTIDRLWTESSQGQFGFSVQRQIYLECGGRLRGDRNPVVWDAFLDRVGWRVAPSDGYIPPNSSELLKPSPDRQLQAVDQICYSLDAPAGYFPCPLVQPTDAARASYDHFMDHRSLYEHRAWRQDAAPWWRRLFGVGLFGVDR